MLELMASQALIVKYEQAVNKIYYEPKLYCQGDRVLKIKLYKEL